MYGVDWEGPMAVEETMQVEIPTTHLPLTEDDHEILRASINPLRNTTQHGMDIYQDVLFFVINRIQVNE